VINIYKGTKSFPSDEKYGLTSQIRRAAVSIPANIAEGSARTTTKEFLHFISIAQGSSSELETELLIAQKLGYLNKETYFDLKTEAENIGRMMIGLANHLKQKL
jgi:four helix bundle protein